MANVKDQTKKEPQPQLPKMEDVSDNLYNYDQKKHNAFTSTKPWAKEYENTKRIVKRKKKRRNGEAFSPIYSYKRSLLRFILFSH